MPSIGEALRERGYLSDVAGNIQLFIDKLNKKADQDEFNKLMTSAITDIQKTYSDEEEPTFISGQPQSRLGDLLPRLGTREGQPPVEQEELPEDLLLGDVTGRRFGTLSEDEQRMKIQKTIAETLMKSGQLEDLDPSKITQGTQILDLFGKAVTPKKKTKELKQIDPQKDLYEIDQDGNFTLVKPGKTESKYKSVGSYTGKDGFHYTKMYDPVSGKTYEVKSENKVRPPRGLKIDFPEPDKWKEFGSVLNYIEYKEELDQYGVATGQVIETTEAEKKQRRQIAQNKALGNMEPGAVDFMRTDIWNAWNRENMSQEDFEIEIEQGLNAGEISAEEAQDLLDYNAFRPFLYDVLIETVIRNPEE
jgi:hypothetical protein